MTKKLFQDKPRFICFSELPIEISSLINDFRKEMVLEHNIPIWKSNYTKEFHEKFMRYIIFRLADIRYVINSWFYKPMESYKYIFIRNGGRERFRVELIEI